MSISTDISTNKTLSLLLLLALILTAVGAKTAKAQESLEGTYTLMPMGHQSVPKAITSASGLFTLKIQNDSLMVKGKFEGLTSHHHRSFIGVGPKGETGNVLFTLDVELLNEEQTSGKVAYSGNEFALTRLHKKLIREGEFYIAVSSNNYKMGEIRDQLIIDQ